VNWKSDFALSLTAVSWKKRRSTVVMPESLPLTDNTIELRHTAEVEPIDVQSAVDEVGVLNDEVMIEIAPDRPSGTIQVRLKYAGRSAPLPADDPSGE
jgi:hypothetical protein